MLKLKICKVVVRCFKVIGSGKIKCCKVFKSYFLEYKSFICKNDLLKVIFVYEINEENVWLMFLYL